tara:strand:- start:362 stop:886 length:525 start_codon:yes stop_codon:yes gene_type:complete
MNLALRLIVLIIPVSFIIMFFVLLSDEKSIPGADYKVSNLPVFSLPNLENNSIIEKTSLDGDYILNVWASWCITCRVEHPYLSKLKKGGIRIIGLNYKDERTDASKWLKKFGNPYDVVIYDIKGTLALDLGVTGAPETFLISNGEVVAHYQGEVNQMIWEKVFEPVIISRNIAF